MVKSIRAKALASLTVRQLDDALKRLLRLRAARHGRSMEDEVRVILREAAEQIEPELALTARDGKSEQRGGGRR